ncbi:DUF262 domain-containing protein [Limnobacter sp.]|uniref:DUF262 domain-containing protein n=1 Tax=Limnobacter sp. TaxID=2003368 RepID=UPI0027377A5D|nr:DUF262 domain-containing protein [Limnobacter sp.]MDP3189209.1 DUF262 domain-containing protein [Limnobacter sp.]
MPESTETTELWNVDETETPEMEEADVISYQISYYPADFTLKGYLDKWNAKSMIVPAFQRNYVWDQVQASKLIESFLLGLPVPGVFLYKERNTNRLQIIDGQQRILTAIRFFKNSFGEKSFRLKNVHPRWEGKTYEELDEAQRLQLDDTVLRATVVQQLDPNDDSSIYHIFERLNTGGTRLNAMEVRKCVYSGRFFKLLEELNTHSSWRAILGQPKLDARLRDVELVLRVLTLSHSWRTYEKPMKQALNRFIVEVEKTNFDDSAFDIVLLGYATNFFTTCDRIYASLGEKPFHLRGRLNYAVLDSVFSAVYNANCAIDDLAEKYQALILDATYLEHVTKNTSDESAISKRFKAALDFLV